MWSGKTVAVLASGKSMTAAVAESVRGLPTIAINNTFRLAPWADVIYAADVEWWQHLDNADALLCPGIKVCCPGEVRRVPPTGVYSLRMTGRAGVEDDPGAVRTGSNSGYQAVHVAYHAGASRILLCGFNMSGQNWHGAHKAGLRTTCDATYVTWIRLFEDFVRELGKRGVEVMQCTPNSSLHLDYVPLEEAIAGALPHQAAACLPA